jgi:hypothetical protein
MLAGFLRKPHFPSLSETGCRLAGLNPDAASFNVSCTTKAGRLTNPVAGNPDTLVACILNPDGSWNQHRDEVTRIAEASTLMLLL